MSEYRNMSEYKEGDTLTIIPRLIGSQTSKVRGVLVKDRDDTGEWTIRPEGIRYAYDFNQDDWVIEEIEHAPAPLPTEAGYYLDKDFALWTVETNGYRRLDAGTRGFLDGKLARQYAPFIRLRTEQETASEVFRRLEAALVSVIREADSEPRVTLYEADLRAIASTYGVKLP